MRFKRLFLIPIIILGVTAAAILAQYGLPRSSGDVRALFPISSPTLTALQRMELLFGESLFDSLLVTLPEEIDDTTQEQLAELRDEIGTLPGVVSVISPVEGLSKLGIPIRTLTPDRRTGRFLIEIDSTLDDPQRAELHRALDERTAHYGALRPIRAGAFAVSEEVTAALRRESERWTPVCVAVLIAISLLLLRNLRITFAVLTAPFLALLILFATLRWFDIPLLPIAQLVPPLLLGLGASYSVFIACRYIDAIDASDPARKRGVVGSTLLACITTIAGFASLIPLDTRAVAQFGILMTCGTALAGALSILITPIMLPQTSRRVARTAVALRKLTVSSPVRTSLFLPLVVLTAIFSIGIPRLAIDTSPLDFLPKGSPRLRAVSDTLTRFPGSHQLFVTLERATPFDDADEALIKQISTQIQQISGVHAVTSIADFIALDDRLAARGELAEGASLMPMRYGPSSFTTEDRHATRLFIETDAEGRTLLTLRDEILSRIPAQLPATITAAISSRELILAEQSDALARGLVLSIGSALGLVGLLLLAVSRSLILTAIGLIPSLLPILIVLGGLGLSAGQVDMGTAMVAAVALGMISDNTFHLLIASRYRSPNTTLSPLAVSSGPMIATALLLVAAFCPTIFSNLPPMHKFGLLLSICVLLGLTMNICLLPQLLSKYGVSTRSLPADEKLHLDAKVQ
jgi:predicted RND superfamily exporter protein